MTAFLNPKPLSDDDRFDTWLRSIWDQFSTDLDYRYGRLPAAEASARRLAALGVYVDPARLQAVLDARVEPVIDPAIEAELERLLPPEEIERRLAELLAGVERAGRESNPHEAE